MGAGDLGGVADAQVPPRCRVGVQPLGNGAQVGELMRAEPAAERGQIEPARRRLEREAELGGFQGFQRSWDPCNSDPPVLSSKITLQIRTLICSVVGSGIRFSDAWLHLQACGWSLLLCWRSTAGPEGAGARWLDAQH